MGQPTAQVFSLGGMTLNELVFEVPEDLSLARSTLGGVTDIPQTDGNAALRIAQTLGVVPEKISFEASFIGVNAEIQVAKLEAMQLAQAVVTFTAGNRSYDVVVFHVGEVYRNQYDIRYSVELEPLVDTSFANSSSPISATAAAQIAMGNVALATVLPPPATLDPRLLPTLAPLATANATAASISSTPTLLDSLAQVQTTISQLTAANASLLTVAQGVIGSTATADVALFQQISPITDALNTGIDALNNLTGGSAEKGVLPGSYNGFSFAARYTGDADNVWAILAANNLTDPFQLGSAPLVIPKVLSL